MARSFVRRSARRRSLPSLGGKELRRNSTAPRPPLNFLLLSASPPFFPFLFLPFFQPPFRPSCFFTPRRRILFHTVRCRIVLRPEETLIGPATDRFAGTANEIVIPTPIPIATADRYLLLLLLLLLRPLARWFYYGAAGNNGADAISSRNREKSPAAICRWWVVGPGELAMKRG